MCRDKLVIDLLGGPANVARNFGYTIQQVCNWGNRGIPPKEILRNDSFRHALAAVGYEGVPFDLAKKTRRAA